MDSLWSIDEETFSAFQGQNNGPKQLEEQILEKMGLSSMRDNQRAMVVFELVFQVIEFVSRSSLSFTHFQILLEIYHKCFERFIVNNEGSQAEAIEVFKEDMLSQGGLDVDISRSVAEFFSTSLIRNMEGYRYVMSHLPVEVVDKRVLAIQTPLSVLPSLDADISNGDLNEASMASSMTKGTAKSGGASVKSKVSAQ